MATVLHKILEQKLQEAISAVLGDAGAAAILVRPCPDPKFGDYQTNALMALAKARKANPRQLAAEVMAKLANPVVVDARNLLDPAQLRRIGFEYTGIGRR